MQFPLEQLSEACRENWKAEAGRGAADAPGALLLFCRGNVAICSGLASLPGAKRFKTLQHSAGLSGHCSGVPQLGRGKGEPDSWLLQELKPLAGIPRGLHISPLPTRPQQSSELDAPGRAPATIRRARVCANTVRPVTLLLIN